MRATKPVTKPTKQRKMLFQAPDHVRYKHFAASLSSELRASHGTRALPVRSGDTIRIMRGDRKGFEGKVTRIDRKKYRIYVEGLTREKVDGTTIFAPVHPSKVMITRLNLNDKWRNKILERKRKARKKEVIEEKAVEEIIEEKVVADAKLPEKKPKRKKRKVVNKPAEKKKAEKAEKPKRPKKVKKAAKKKTEKAKKEEKLKKRKTRIKRKPAKKTEGEP